MQLNRHRQKDATAAAGKGFFHEDCATRTALSLFSVSSTLTLSLVLYVYCSHMHLLTWMMGMKETERRGGGGDDDEDFVRHPSSST